MPIIAMINLKGGVAKTTNTIALAECLAAQEHLRTLVIDADHQCSATELLIGEARLNGIEKQKKTLHDLFLAMWRREFDSNTFKKDYVISNVSTIARGLPKLSVLPGSLRIHDIQRRYESAKLKINEEGTTIGRRESTRVAQIQRWLRADFDYVFIDCPPNMATHQVKFLLRVADAYIVPTIPDRLSVRGSLFLKRAIHNHGLKIPALGTLWSMVLGTSRIHDKVMTMTSDKAEPYGDLPEPFEATIPNTAAMGRAMEEVKEGQEPSTFLNKYPGVGKKIEQLCGEIIQRVEWMSSKSTPELESTTLS